MLALYYAAISVAISSLTTRRIIAGATIIGLLLISGHRERDPRRGRGGRASEERSTGPPSTVITEEGDVIVVPSGDEDVVRR